jgi:hypothetical protein
MEQFYRASPRLPRALRPSTIPARMESRAPPGGYDFAWQSTYREGTRSGTDLIRGAALQQSGANFQLLEKDGGGLPCRRYD